MARNKGLFNFSGNLEVTATAPLDARIVVGSKADLINPSTWAETEANVKLYDGLVVSVTEAGKYGLYMLLNYDPTDAVKAEAYKKAENWVAIDATAAEKTTVIDDLNSSTNSTDALSAKQGYVLDQKIGDVQTQLDEVQGQLEEVQGQLEEIDVTDQISTALSDYDSSVLGAIEDLSTNINSSISELAESFEGLSEELNETISEKLSSVYRYAGTVDDYDELEDYEAEAEIGDVYNVAGEGPDGEAPGTNYVWTGEEWDALAGIVDLSAYATVEYVDGSLGLVNSSITNINSSITDINSSITDINSSITNINGSIGALQTHDTLIDSSIKLLRDSFDAFFKNSDGDSSTTFSGALAGLKEEITSEIKGLLEDEYATLEYVNGSLGTVNDTLTKLDTSIKSIDSSLLVIDSSITKIEASLEVLYEDENTEKSILYVVANSSVRTELDALSSSLTGLVTKHSSDILEINSSISSMKTDIATLQDLLTWNTIL